jgi:hypothetical protein
MYLKPDMMDYLWFNQKFERATCFPYSTPIPHHHGDVMYSKVANKLWFVGPETDKTHLQGLAAFALSETDIMMSVLYQPGAGHQEPTRKSALERVLADESV